MMERSLYNQKFAKLTGFLVVCLTLIGSSCTIENTGDRDVSQTREFTLGNTPMVDGQVLPPDNIKTIQIYRENDKGSVPAVELGTDEYITLRFDELGASPRMFRVRVHHRNADWSHSHLIRDLYVSGYREDHITGGEPSGVQEPDYVHYRYRFPNEDMQVTLSGNYLLEVLDYETGQSLFSKPFFVYDNQGAMSFDMEELYVRDERYMLHHQPFVRFRYPSDVVSPITDLQLYFVQNRFWGRARKAGEEDMSEAGIYRSYLSRPASFVGIYEFRPLDLRRYDEPGPDVVEIRSETIPPQVHLFRDVVNLDVEPRRRSPSIHGVPRDDHRARYIDVRFELELAEGEETDQPIYVYGPFNNWTIHEDNRMEYRESTDSYVGRAVVKEGEYDYKYAVVEEGRIDDLRLDASFASHRQEYTSLIYFRDPGLRADRLLIMRTDQIR